MKKTNKKVSDREFNTFSKALSKYLDKNGWSVIAVGPYSIEKDPSLDGDYRFRFVANFMSTKKYMKKNIEQKQLEYNEGMRKEFVRLRIAVRNGLWRGAGIPSNPGWSDDDVIAGIEAWAELTYFLRTVKKLNLQDIENEIKNMKNE
jgi:hypothetical protein